MLDSIIKYNAFTCVQEELMDVAAPLAGSLVMTHKKFFFLGGDVITFIQW